MVRFAFGLLMAVVVSLMWFFVAVWLVLPVTFISEVVVPVEWEGLMGYVARLLISLTTIAAAIQGFFLGMWLLKS